MENENKNLEETGYEVSETAVPEFVEEETPAVVTEQAAKAVVRVGEIVELREENCKVFQMSDGAQQMDEAEHDIRDIKNRINK